uniref:Uncharacterized protein n=1 Tax=Anguilla anguilla TaxID=7936 RepID=A0A0E9WM88_ANGAN
MVAETAASTSSGVVNSTNVCKLAISTLAT